MVLDLDQARRHLHQRRLAAGLGAGDDAPRASPVASCTRRAQLAQAQHAERVADLLQQRDLRHELLGLAAAAAHVDIQHILDLRQILADRRGHGVHQLDRGRGQILALLLDRLVHRQQLVQPERGAHRRDARAAAAGARDVIEQVVQQFDRRVLRVARLALLEQALHLAIGQPQQPLDRDAAVDAVLAQRLDQCADHPPQLEYRLRAWRPAPAASPPRP